MGPFLTAGWAFLLLGATLGEAIQLSSPPAGSPWSLLRRFGSGGGEQRIEEASKRLRAELREWSTRETEDRRATIEELIDELVAARVPVPRRGLGSGLWVSAFTRGNEPRWQRNAKLLAPFAKTKNLAGQQYFQSAERESRVINYGEIFGSSLFVTASGTFQKASGSQGLQCPQDFDVFIDSGALTILGNEIPLPVKGTGLLRVLFANDECRIFVSPTDSPDRWEEAGLVVVQIPVRTVRSVDWTPGYEAP